MRRGRRVGGRSGWGGLDDHDRRRQRSDSGWVDGLDQLVEDVAAATVGQLDDIPPAAALPGDRNCSHHGPLRQLRDDRELKAWPFAHVCALGNPKARQVGG